MKNRCIISLLMLLTSWGVSNAQDRSSYSLIRKDGKVDPRIRGIWKSIGNGYMLNANPDSVLLYSFTSSFCYKEKNEHLESLLNTQARFRIEKDSLTILMTDYGQRSDQIQISHHYVRIDSLPKATLSFVDMTRLAPPVLFDLFIETIAENYAFSKERNMDWAAIRREYGRRVNEQTTNDSLFKIIGDVVTSTKDHHTKIVSETGQVMQYRSVKSADTLAAAFKEQSAITNQNEYINEFFKGNYKNISDSLLHGEGKKAANGKIEWGSLNNKIGYIHIHSFNDFGPKGSTRAQQIDSITNVMEQIMAEFAEKQALIVDVSFNFGGYDPAALAIAGFFTDKPVFSYTSQVNDNGRFYDESKVYVYPSGKAHFVKPVYLMTSDITRSAAEVFVLAMKSLPQVKLVGSNSLGIQSSMLGKSIGPFYCTCSNQRLLSSNNKCYEVTGVTPDILVKVFPKKNILSGHMMAVRSIMSHIEN